MIMLWSYFFSSREFEKADDIWEKYNLAASDRIFCRYIERIAIKNQDLELVQKLSDRISPLDSVSRVTKSQVNCTLIHSLRELNSDWFTVYCRIMQVFPPVFYSLFQLN